MQFHPIVRGPDAFQQSLTSEQVQAVCARALGAGIQVASARELGGGEFNNVYVIELVGRERPERVILRVAPAADRFLPSPDERLMHREHAIQPYFAPVAPLLPRTLASDFTRTVIPRDYLVQTVMPGEPWNDKDSNLTLEQEESLWRELARIARTIHAVEGETFGHPHPGRQYPTWSTTVLDWLQRCAADAEREGLDATPTHQVRDIASAHADLLDEIARPRLCHGDLWSFNVLIDRTLDPPRISAVLDYDRAYWGDPMADWTFHLLPRRASPRVQAIFLDEYSHPDESPSAYFRRAVYDGLHIGNVLSHAARRKQASLLMKAQEMLVQAVAELRAWEP